MGIADLAPARSSVALSAAVAQRPPARAVIAQAPTLATDPVFVYLPDVSQADLVGPCKWSPDKGSIFPAVGASALIVWDNTGAPVVVWWDGVPLDLATQAALDAIDARVAALEALHYCSLGISAGVGMGSGGVVPWSLEIADPLGLHVASASSIVVDLGGVWDVSLNALGNISPPGASTFSASVLKNGVGASDSPNGSTLMEAVTFNYRVSVSGPMVLAAGDALSVVISQNGGGACTFQPGSLFSAVYRGPA